MRRRIPGLLLIAWVLLADCWGSGPFGGEPWKLGAIASGSPVWGQEWVRFRGPNGSGVNPESRLPTVLTKENVLWSCKLPLAGHSSPVLWGDRIFLTGADNEKTATRGVFALNANSGELLWNREYPSEFHKKHEFNSFASCTSTVDADRLYAMWTTPKSLTVLSFDHQGNELWKRDLGEYVCRHSGGTSPILYQGLLIFSAEQDEEGGGKSSLVALDALTGETRWVVERTSKHVPYSTPYLFELPGQRAQVLFNSTPHGMTAIDPLTGGKIWEMPDLLDKRAVGSGFVLNDKWVTATCGFGGGGIYMVIVEPGNGSPGSEPKLIRKMTKQVPYVPTGITRNHRMYFWEDKGIVTSFEAESGKQVWQKRVGGTFYSSPVICGEAIYNVSNAGELVVVSTKDEFEELSRLDLGGLCHSSPAIAVGKLFVRTYDQLHAIGFPKTVAARE